MYANYGPVDTVNKYRNVGENSSTNQNTLLTAKAYSNETADMAPYAQIVLAGLLRPFWW